MKLTQPYGDPVMPLWWRLAVLLLVVALAYAGLQIAFGFYAASVCADLGYDNTASTNMTFDGFICYPKASNILEVLP